MYRCATEEILPYITLNNQVRMPRVGLGTFKSKGRDVHEAVQAALQAGLRLIDTASIYKVNDPTEGRFLKPFDAWCKQIAASCLR